MKEYQPRNTMTDTILETRSIGQTVWYNNRTVKPLKIEKVFAKYVLCSDGKQYNLKPGLNTGNQRGFYGGQYTLTPSITG
jgi:hypothetical protein